jgi:hypothetical protein
MVHVLIVESDDDTCLSLRQAIVAAGARVTIEGNVVGARAVLRDAEDVGLLVADTKLPDGAGTDIARDAAIRGIPFILVRPAPTGLTILNAQGIAFRGPILGALVFLSGLLTRVNGGTRDVTPRWQASASLNHDHTNRTSHHGRTVRER